jgi:hypothetical protein
MPLYSIIIIMWKNSEVNIEASHYVGLFGGNKIGKLIYLTSLRAGESVVDHVL